MSLESVKKEFPALSWADLIVLAGTVALETPFGMDIPFCSGRVDAVDASVTSFLTPRIYADVLVTVRDNMKVMGLSARALVALTARRAAARGESGTYFKILLADVWSPVTGDFENPLDALYKSNGYVVRAEELAIVWDPEFKAIPRI